MKQDETFSSLAKDIVDIKSLILANTRLSNSITLGIDYDALRRITSESLGIMTALNVEPGWSKLQSDILGISALREQLQLDMSELLNSRSTLEAIDQLYAEMTAFTKPSLQFSAIAQLQEALSASRLYYERSTLRFAEEGDYFQAVFDDTDQPNQDSPSAETRLPASLEIEIVQAISSQMVLELIRNPGELHRMSPRAFEEFIADIVKGFGYRVELTQQSRDGGKDIIAIGNEKFGTVKHLIECKRYAPENKVDVGQVRALFGVVNIENATKGIIVTTSGFTEPAERAIQAMPWRMEGRDLKAIQEWLREYHRMYFG